MNKHNLKQDITYTINYCPLKKKDFLSIRDVNEWGRMLRMFEIKCTFSEFSKNTFDSALELGCGSGQNSKYLAYYCKHLFATEYDKDKLTASSNEKVIFSVLDAQNLTQFDDESMDLIYSSNVLEHLPNVDSCLSECRRVIKQNGIIVHTLPNRTWKVFNLLLFYPVLTKIIIRRIFEKKAITRKRKSLDDNLRPYDPSKIFLRKLFPKIHGISKNHLDEFRMFGEKIWVEIFKRNKLELFRIVRLPFYYGHGYQFCVLLRLGNYIGLSASTAYLLRKAKGS